LFLPAYSYYDSSQLDARRILGPSLYSRPQSSPPPTTRVDNRPPPCPAVNLDRWDPGPPRLPAQRFWYRAAEKHFPLLLPALCRGGPTVRFFAGVYCFTGISGRELSCLRRRRGGTVGPLFPPVVAGRFRCCLVRRGGRGLVGFFGGGRGLAARWALGWVGLFGGVGWLASGRGRGGARRRVGAGGGGGGGVSCGGGGVGRGCGVGCRGGGWVCGGCGGGGGLGGGGVGGGDKPKTNKPKQRAVYRRFFPRLEETVYPLLLRIVFLSKAVS